MKPSIFEPVAVEYAGRKYTIPAANMFAAISAIETVIAFPNLAQMVAGNVPPRIATIAVAYATLLQFAGVRDFTVEEIYVDFWRDLQQMAEATDTLMRVFIPPERRAQFEAVA